MDKFPFGIDAYDGVEPEELAVEDTVAEEPRV